MARTGLLVVTNLSKIRSSLSAVKKYVSKTLYIHFHPDKSSLATNLKPPSAFSKCAAQIYSTSLRACNQLDVIVIVGHIRDYQQWQKTKTQLKPVDVLLFDQNISGDETTQFMNRYNTQNVVEFTKSDLESNAIDGDTNPLPSIQLDVYNEDYGLDGESVCLGGTFDRLHCGHKLLLTEAVLRAKKRVIVGVTDVNMTNSKLLRELIEPVEERINSVRKFLMSIDHTLIYEVVPIQDPFGPTQNDPNIDIIIVSSETLRGGEKVNEIRLKNGLSPLKIHCIDLIELETNEEAKETKISSSNQRLDLLGTRFRSPKPNPTIPKYPYIIGLVGGIASGKSVMLKYFENHGATVLNCDKMAHELYEPGTKCYQEIVDKFGREILLEDGKINRKALGAIVFADKNRLTELNQIVWPELLNRVKEVINQIGQAKEKAIVIVEAAVLLQANWQTEMHEIWSLIVPPERAIQRLVNRDNLTKDQAQQRVDAQPRNEEMVKVSNVVFSTQWSYEFSQHQAQKAWNSLMDYLKERDASDS